MISEKPLTQKITPPISIQQFTQEKLSNFVQYLTATFGDNQKFHPLLQQMITIAQCPLNDFVIYIATQLKPTTPEVWLQTITADYFLKREDFTDEQYSKITRYLHCFVDIVSIKNDV